MPTTDRRFSVSYIAVCGVRAIAEFAHSCATLDSPEEVGGSWSTATTLRAGASPSAGGSVRGTPPGRCAERCGVRRDDRRRWHVKGHHIGRRSPIGVHVAITSHVIGPLHDRAASLVQRQHVDRRRHDHRARDAYQGGGRVHPRGCRAVFGLQASGSKARGRWPPLGSTAEHFS